VSDEKDADEKGRAKAERGKNGNSTPAFYERNLKGELIDKSIYK